jgi:penicillin-binding protein 2
MNGSPAVQNHLESWRLWSFVIVVGVIFAIYIGRLFSLQVLEHEDWNAQALDNSTATINTPALRGIIYDRNGIILARNVASYNVVITGANLPDDPGAIQEIFREISPLINIPINGAPLRTGEDDPPEAELFVPCKPDLRLGISQIAEYAQTATPYQSVRLKCNIDERTAMVIQEKSVDWPGISVEIQPIRDYPTGEITASLIGFLGPIPASLEDFYRAEGLLPNRDKVGYSGLELQYQDLLAGNNGSRVTKIDVAGKALGDVVPPVAPTPGLNLRLTIDTRLQQVTEEILKKELREWNSYFGEMRYSSGVVIAINPRTGEILSMVSYPSYENNRMAREIPAYYYDQLVKDPTQPLLNHAVGDVLPAGSVFKLVTAVGALNEKVVTPEQIITTPGKIVLQEKFYQNDLGRPREFVDWIYKNGQNPGGFGQLNFVGGLANSSNVYFYKLGGGYEDEVPNGGLGICRLGTYAQALGFGASPEVGLPYEESGLIPDPTWKRINHSESWSSGDTYIASVGQGYVLATPMQVLLSAAIIANNGKFIQPTLIREVVDGEGNVLPVYLDAEGNTTFDAAEGVRQLSPFNPGLKWDLTVDPVIQEYNETTIRGCEPIEGQKKTVEPWVFDKVREGMRMAVLEGTLKDIFDGIQFAAGGKTGTAEYCDQYANALNRCIPGNWPAHAWTVAFAPYEEPEIAVVAWVYNGTEGSTVAGPIVRQVLEKYFQIKSIDSTIQAQ